ncbi:hypothetical protein [Nonomuraea maheshkhaliensis]
MTFIPRLSASFGSHSLTPVAHRVCRRTLPDASAVRIGDTVDGGVQIWLDTTAPQASSSWAALHRIQHQLQLLGLHVEIEHDAQGLVVLGWSSRFLMHRARLLRMALRGQLSDYWATAQSVVTLSAHLWGQPGRTNGESIAAVAFAHVQEQLRWPGWLADLEGWRRYSDLAEHQTLLARVIGLEARVAQACEGHLVSARLVATSMRRELDRTENRREAAYRVLAAATPWLRAGQLLAHTAADQPGDPPPLVAGGPAAGLTERLIAVSVINHGRWPETSPRWS